MKKRTAKISRKTKETDIAVNLLIDGKGKADIKTGIGFLDHMLTLFAKHGFFDLNISAKGDLDVDIHHTNEDVGITLGSAFKKALGDKKGITRFGDSFVPMDGCLTRVTADISNRPSLHVHYRTKYKLLDEYVIKGSCEYSFVSAEQFIRAFIMNAGINMHIEILGFDNDLHHLIEAVFKAMARALDEATQIDKRAKGVPSTKGKL
ncbi:MAG: imidazoleglycerol-phosphate dehydratase HisB [Candidatus Omnitrophica bacterium CG_4_9_14_0_2_um_filter_42_8]|nr:MAG: imidazoleglycerol-phosphate dehydratase [Candidatus Omnitrophica bacterium CG22_combo_CG10-13_8_21_14_all_43_16]PJC47988.1 MAG: imidazoleglycerol-phosphate dehydratase HisB [Candidatus Omnitrophica bacterium CG_4_9_14_0_2_um_filter_42_8]